MTKLAWVAMKAWIIGTNKSVRGRISGCSGGLLRYYCKDNLGLFGRAKFKKIQSRIF